MSTAPSHDSATQVPPLAIDKGQQLAKTGLVISAIGFGGWLLMLTIIFSIPMEEYSGDGQRDLVIGFGNFMSYLLRVGVGLLGMSINGTLSLTGTTISLSARTQSASPKATSGLLLGLAGLAIGAALVLWRMSVWGVFK